MTKRAARYLFVGYVTADGFFQRSGDMGTKTFDQIFASSLANRSDVNGRQCEAAVLHDGAGFHVVDLFQTRKLRDGSLVPIFEQSFEEEDPAVAYAVFMDSTTEVVDSCAI